MYRMTLTALIFLGYVTATSAQSPSVSGSWTGYWESDMNGHNGPLHARIRQINDDNYRASFRGRFAGVIPFWYSTKMHVESADENSVVLGANQRLPFLGEYQTTAVITSDHFDATFTSRRDYGRFVMSRRR